MQLNARIAASIEGATAARSRRRAQHAKNGVTHSCATTRAAKTACTWASSTSAFSLRPLPLLRQLRPFHARLVIRPESIVLRRDAVWKRATRASESLEACKAGTDDARRLVRKMPTGLVRLLRLHPRALQYNPEIPGVAKRTSLAGTRHTAASRQKTAAIVGLDGNLRCASHCQRLGAARHAKTTKLGSVPAGTCCHRQPPRLISKPRRLQKRLSPPQARQERPCSI
eukprot:1858443-Pleurochrysis_carterae.AAC.1